MSSYVYKNSGHRHAMRNKKIFGFDIQVYVIVLSIMINFKNRSFIYV